MSPRGVIRLMTAGVLLTGAIAIPSAAHADDGVNAGLARSPELSETTRLPDRRSVATGDRFYEVGTEDGLYPAQGWHTTGEMGGFWSPPVKLLDGMWLALNDSWLGKQIPAAKFTSGWGYTRTEFSPSGGVHAARTDFAPDGLRAGLVGLTLTSEQSTDLRLTLNAHSELMNAYPWGSTTPSQSTFNQPDTGTFDGNALVFREQGTPPTPGAAPHDYSAVVGSTLPAGTHQLGPDFRGPQTPPVICPATGEPPAKCDDSAYGKGTGGQLTYQVPLKSGTPTTLWFAVAGSDQNLAEARSDFGKALADPVDLLRAKVMKRQAVASNTAVDLPADPLLQQSVQWSKQNLADAAQEAHKLQIRATQEGKQYPAPSGTLDSVRWLGAGWPDYPWMFGTDGEYTSFASVAAGQFGNIESHLRSLEQVSEIVNNRSGKVMHEMTPDGSVYFGENTDAGNTDETAKFPSAVALVWRWTGDNRFRDEMYDFAVRNLHYIASNLDSDKDGWPEGSGNVERPGMGPEKLDNAVYYIRGLRDLADMASSKGDTATDTWASNTAAGLEKKFEATWWAPGDAKQYADSLREPGDTTVFQRHWIGLTPMDAEIVRRGQPTRPLASNDHGSTGVAQRELPCYSDALGLFHTGTGPTSDPAGNKGASCDSSVSTVQSDRESFTINTGIMANAEGNFGRMGTDQQQRFTTANARAQLDPKVWEMPGAMPEIAPSPDFGANIDKKFTQRSMVLQAWGAYGQLWPVVHQQLGIAPDMGRNQLSVIPQVPDGQHHVAGRDIRLAAGSVDVSADRDGQNLRTTVTRTTSTDLSIGHVLPPDAAVRSVQLDGHPVPYQIVDTARGREVVAAAGIGTGTSTLEIQLG